MNKRRIFVVDDEKLIRDIICTYLNKAGYQAEGYEDGESAKDAYEKSPPDMIILDIMLPGMDGYAFCELVRQKSKIPIIIVSAKDKEPDKVKGLNLGSDDYMVKPFSPIELIARVNALFRRSVYEEKRFVSETADTATAVAAADTATAVAAADTATAVAAADTATATAASALTSAAAATSASAAASAAAAVETEKGFSIGDVRILTEGKQAICNGKNLRLTGMELSLLTYLTVNKHRAVSRNELLHKIWGFETYVDTRATDDMIKRIRKKLIDAGSELKIETVWGYGFKLV